MQFLHDFYIKQIKIPKQLLFLTLPINITQIIHKYKRIHIVTSHVNTWVVSYGYFS